MPSWILWLILAALLVLPVVAVLVEDRPPQNEIRDEQDPRDPAPNQDGDAEMRAAALVLRRKGMLGVRRDSCYPEQEKRRPDL